MLVNLRAGNIIVLDDDIQYANYKRMHLEKRRAVQRAGLGSAAASSSVEEEKKADVTETDKPTVIDTNGSMPKVEDVDEVTKDTKTGKSYDWLLQRTVPAGKKVDPELIQV